MGYLYRFLDKDNNILYIGKTSKSLLSRLKKHNHLPNECYKNINKVEYKAINNLSDLALLEIYYINNYLPLYNKDSKGPEPLTINLIDPYEDWKEFDYQACNINLNAHTQIIRQSLTEEEKKKRQLTGIERAKQKGKYKGRKRIDINKETFIEACRRWRLGECTAKSVYKSFNISSQTFYRRVNEWNL